MIQLTSALLIVLGILFIILGCILDCTYLDDRINSGIWGTVCFFIGAFMVIMVSLFVPQLGITTTEKPSVEVIKITEKCLNGETQRDTTYIYKFK